MDDMMVFGIREQDFLYISVTGSFYSHVHLTVQDGCSLLAITSIF